MFTITYLMLRLFQRFPLRELEVFEHQFTSKLLMVCGPNGSGKSSLFNELTPLPADKANFYPGGYKEIRLHSDTHQYTLISDFTDGTCYRFLVDGEELNLSNNVTTQRELVYQHFKITPTIHELLIGSENFTDMGLAARKKLFSSITHLNIDKVLANYNQLKEELKNNELVLKTQTSLLQAEESKLLDKTRFEALVETQTRTKDFIDFLLETRSELTRYTQTGSPEELYGKIQQLHRTIYQICHQRYANITAFPVGDLERYKLDYTARQSVTTHEIQQLYQQLERKHEELKALALTRETTLAAVQSQYQDCCAQRERLQRSLRFLADTSSVLTEVKNSVYLLEGSLPEVLRALPLNPERQYSKDRYERLLNEKKLALEQITELLAKERTLTQELHTLKTTDDTVQCPSCTHRWSPKDLPAAIAHSQNHLAQLLQDKIQHQQRLQELDKELTELTEYFTLYRQYTQLRASTHGPLKAFWDHVDEARHVFTDPPKILTLLSQLNHELVTIEELSQLDKTLTGLQKNLTVLSQLRETSTDAVHQEIQDLEMTLEDLHSYKTYLTQTLATMERTQSLYTYLEQLQTALHSTVDALRDAHLSHTTHALLSTIESDLSKHKVILIETEKELHQYSTIQYTIDKHRKIIEDIQSNVKVLNIILDELSPKNGLIAKSVSSFLNVIISNINATLGSLWEYKMVLKPIDVEAEALNYRFKVEVEDKLTIHDISGISRGMKEAVNLAFKMVLYKLLGLHGTPFYADELASNLDKHHTAKMAELIHQLSLSDKYSQIFLITHKENLGFLRDVDTLSLEA